MNKLIITLVISCLFYNPITAQNSDDERIPIKVSRFVIDIDEGKVVGIFNNKIHKQGEKVIEESKYLTLNKLYNQNFRSASSFYEESLKKQFERQLFKKGFDVPGWGIIF
jgi:hypothetical protein